MFVSFAGHSALRVCLGSLLDEEESGATLQERLWTSAEGTLQDQGGSNQKSGKKQNNWKPKKNLRKCH